MQVTQLSLTNFRNYGRLELVLPGGPTLLHGDNAQGKTNLLEALYYLATTRSPHADQDQQLINWEALQPFEPVVVGRITAQVETRDGPKQLEMRLIREEQRGRVTFRRQALVNRRKVRLMDLLGNLRVVMFLPQDVQIVTGSPSVRRRYLDITLCQTDRQYCRNLTNYNKILEQRNALLRRIAENGDGLDLLPIYTDKLVQAGSQIFIRRAAFVQALAREARQIHYEELTDGRETLRLDYLPRLQDAGNGRVDEEAVVEASEIGRWLAEEADLETVSQRFQKVLAECRQSEIGSGMTRIGPHRDDWSFLVSGRDLASYGSRGQQRTAILALKLAEIRWMASETRDNPVLLLDEVVAELDEKRRALLLETVQKVNQALLTATDPGMFTDTFLSSARLLRVKAGQVTAESVAAPNS